MFTCKDRLRYSREQALTSLLYEQGSQALIWDRFCPWHEAASLAALANHHRQVSRPILSGCKDWKLLRQASQSTLFLEHSVAECVGCVDVHTKSCTVRYNLQILIASHARSLVVARAQFSIQATSLPYRFRFYVVSGISYILPLSCISTVMLSFRPHVCPT